MNIRKRTAYIAATLLALTFAVGLAGCSEKAAEPSTATATSAGNAGAGAAPQQPAEQGKAAAGGAGNQLPKPLTPPP